MIALLIGTVLVLGLVQVFSASRTAYQLSEGMARAQENGRFAMEYLQRDIRMAGHFGCVNDQSHLQMPGQLVSHFAAAVDPFPVNFTVSIQGYNATGSNPGGTVALAAPAAGWSPALPAAVAGLTPLPGSDIIVLRYLREEGVPVTAINAAGTEMQVASSRWGAITDGGVADPQIFGIADCSYADVFATTGVAAAGAVTTVSAAASVGLSSRYTAQPAGQTMLFRAESLVYYIDTGAGGEPALFRARFDGANYVPEELVEGIENLQLMFGLDRVPDLSVAPPSGYVDLHNTAQAAWTANDWRRVGLVQVGLLARSPDRAAAAASTIPKQLLNVRMQPPATNDGRHRGVYEASIALRNRLYGN
jgi:type IV pilus assembly protein PilW